MGVWRLHTLADRNQASLSRSEDPKHSRFWSSYCSFESGVKRGATRAGAPLIVVWPYTFKSGGDTVCHEWLRNIK